MFPLEHNGLQQPQCYVNKRGNGIPPKFKALGYCSEKASLFKAVSLITKDKYALTA